MKEPKSVPKGHSKVETEDGSYTFYSEAYDENCHSTTGALGETRYYFIEKSGFKDFCEKNSEVHVFESGWGLGVNFLEALKFKKDSFLNFVSTEIDENLILWWKEEFKNLGELKKIKKNDHKVYELKTKEFKLDIILGDASLELPKFLKNKKTSFDFVFQDAFSPKKNPELWSKNWFSLLSQYTKGNLITYSASHSIRKALEEGGWKIENIKGFGKKRSATKASTFKV